jgi:lysozyme
MNRDRLAVVLRMAEASNRPRLFPYADTTGHLTIGYGRNLSGRGIDFDEAESMLQRDIDRASAAASKFPWFAALSEPRQNVVIELVFNMGPGAVLQFVETIRAIQRQDFVEAARHLRDSKWAFQVGAERSGRLAKQLETGAFA